MSDLVRIVRKAMVACPVPNGSSILVAVSGGPDSTALLRALVFLRKDLGLTLNACCVDHGIRSASEVAADVAFVRSLCEAQGVPLVTAAIAAGQLKERAKRESRSLEDVARDERRRLLREAAQRLNADWIAMGHTQDDALETIVMRFLQGSDVAALAGIPEAAAGLIRPLLGCSRATVTDYLRSLGQSWQEDSTNGDLSILRNRVRRVLIPVLAREFPGARSGILSFSRKAELVAELLEGEDGRMSWEATPRGFSMPAEEFFRFPPAVRAANLMRLYDSLRGPSSPRRLPWRFLQPALEDRQTVPGNRARECLLARGHGVQLALRGGRMLWERRIVMPHEKSYFIEVSETGTFSAPGLGVHVSLVRCSGKRSPAAGVMELLARDISWPLVLRSRRRGDEILLEHGATSLKELYTGWKVLEGQRHQVPVLADRKGVVAVLGSAFGYPNRMRRDACIPPGGAADCILVRANQEHGRGT
jgi:tRNA(Ile)-lysidine synthetase-like protein